MKKLTIALLMSAVLASASGCGPTVKNYFASSNNYWSKTSTTAYATVTIENDTGMKSDKGAMGAIAKSVKIASSIAGSVIEQDQGNRMHRIINPNDIAEMVTVGFDENFSGNTHIQHVAQNQSPDLRIFLDVVDYGLYARSAIDAMQFYVAADVKVVYAPELVTIYTRQATVSRTASDVASDIVNMSKAKYEAATDYPDFLIRLAGLRDKLNAMGDVVNIASGVANMAAFFKLTDKDIVTIFQYMAYDAGHVIANELVEAIYQ